MQWKGSEEFRFRVVKMDTGNFKYVGCRIVKIEKLF
jgi:hypothetical protein